MKSDLAVARRRESLEQAHAPASVATGKRPKSYSRFSASFLLAVTLLGASPIFARCTFAQEPKPTEGAAPASDGGDSSPSLTLEGVEAQLEAIEADASLDDAVKSGLRSEYQQAIDSLQSAAEYAAKAEAYAGAVESAPEQTATVRNELQGLEPVDIAIPKDTEELQQRVEAQRATLTSLTEELSEATAELERAKRRPVEFSDRLPEAERELGEIRDQLARLTADDTAESPSLAAERVRLQASHAELSNEIEMLTQEQRSQQQRVELLEAQRQLLERKVENAAAALETLDSALREQLMTTAERIRSRVEGLVRDIPRSDAEVQELAADVKDLVDEFEAAIRDAAQVKAAQQDVTQWLERLRREYASIQEQLALGGGGRVMVQVLMELDARCRAAPQEVARRPVPALDQTRLQSIQVRDKIRRQADFEQRFANRLSAGVAELLEIRRDVLIQLDQRYESLLPALAELQADQRKYLDQVAEVRDYIAEQLFGYGLKSCGPFSFQNLRDLPASIGWVLQPDHWLQFSRALGRLVSTQPLRSLGVLLLVTVLVSLRPRIRKGLQQAGLKTRRISTDRYAFTGEALGWTILLAIPLPALLGYVAWGLGQDASASEWLQGLTRGLRESAQILAAATFTSAVLLPGGLGGVHFGWPQERSDKFRWAIFAGLAVYLPALILTYTCFRAESAEYFESLGRIGMVLALVWISLVTYRLFAARDGIFAFMDSGDHSSYLHRWRRFWFPLLLVCPLALAALAMVGYLLTVVSSSQGFLMTLALIAGGEVLHGLVKRWFGIKRRKLALAEALERRRARQEAMAEREESEAASETIAVDPEEEAELDLDEVTDQTRQLLRVAFSLGILLAVIYFWSHTFAIFEILETVEIPLTRGLTGLQVVQVTLIAIVTYVAVRNLRGLLELAVFRATEIDAGTRHAIYTLCQYGVTAIGAALLLGILQVDWAKFGWIAAALSVGLGFGLQEVVANFVCGLILLFERPIRVGDIVTVEGTTGTVTKIHLRATTITNWDRQEFVVPNKTLITNTLLNWTLSAPLNRIVVPVGVAYGSDTDRAREILLEVAAEHPVVLGDPSPLATFEQFADSTLNLILRCYLPDMDNRLTVIHELHTEIHKRFAAAGIEIAFPQRDLHLRSGWERLRGGDAQQGEQH